MFGIFTAASVVAVSIIVGKLGGWGTAVQNVTELNPVLFQWSGDGDLNHLYPTGTENMIWAVMTGLTWMAVCAVGPWQSSRYLMAKNEHVVVRSAVYAAIGVAALEFLIPTTAVLLNVHADVIPGPTQSMIWAAMNMLPTIVGVVMLTGVLAAGISSATTFLSLIGSSVANDIVRIQDEKKKLTISRIAILVVCAIVLLLAISNPPQIYIVLLLSGTVVVCSWFPVCIVSVWSKRVTKTGAFLGMLFGFTGCAAMKIISSVCNMTLPIYLDSFVVGLAASLIGVVVGSLVSKVSEEEKMAREKMFIAPENENIPFEVKRTKRTVAVFIAFGAIVAVSLLLLWVIPYYRAL